MKKARKPTKRTAAQGNVLTTLPVAMTGRASPAKAAVGNNAAPIGMGKDSRGVELESMDDRDERHAASWMKQAAAIPGFGGKKR